VASPGESAEFLTKLAKSGMASDELAPSAIMLALCTSVNFAHGMCTFVHCEQWDRGIDELQTLAAVLVVDFYLQEKQERERVDLLQLVNKEDKESKEKILAHVREAMRLNPEVGGSRYLDRIILNIGID
jgi:linoleate 10R-lipoxygenase